MDTLTVIQLVLVVSGLAFLAGLFVYLRIKPSAGPEQLFLPCVFFFGIAYSLIFIPFTAPDEYQHYASAYQLSSQLMGRTAENDDGWILMREQDVELLDIELSEEAYERVYGSFFTADESGTVSAYGIEPMAVSAHAYLPQAVGITLGRLFGAGQVLTVYLGRLMNLVFFAVCVWLAIRLAPFGKMAFFGTAMLPMTLELAGSLSYDGFVTGISLLVTAYILNLAYVHPKVGWKELILLALLLGLLAPCKMVYIPLAGLCFLIPREKFGSGRRYAAAIVIVAACMAAGALIVNMDMILAFPQEAEAEVGWAEETGYSFSYILEHPIDTLCVMRRTLAQQFPVYVKMMFGGSLGWLEYETDGVIILFLIVWTLLASLPVKETVDTTQNSVMPVRHRIAALVFCMLTVIGTLVVMFVWWTPLSSPVIEGVQGRYFLPILPAVLLALRCSHITLEKNIDHILITGYAVVNLLVLSGVLAGL